MTKNNLYVDIHVLQTVPSSNINRDDTGSPKTAIYGGATRSRVSSQSWKRAIRKSFKEDIEDADWVEGYRTLRAVQILAKAIQNLNSEISDDDATSKAVEVLKAGGIKVSKDKKTDSYLTKALLLISQGQIDKLAQYAINHDEYDKKELKKVLQENNSLDLALFGRMVADDPELNVDAASQVAHAISTHEIVPEFDYFTALDDMQDTTNAGSAMIGSLEYNSSTLYRYANVNVKELVHNLGENLTIDGLKLFLKEFATTMPTGKQNTFANKTLPGYVMISVRKDTPVNLVTAFEEPVKSRDGYMKKSISRLEEENEDVNKSGIVDKPIITAVWTKYDSKLKNNDTITDVIEEIANTVSEELANENSED